MTRATERWQETMRYAVDTGAAPPGPRRSRWPLALAAVVRDRCAWAGRCRLERPRPRAIGPGSIRTARRSPWPASGRPPSRPGSAATRGTRAPRRTRPQSPLRPAPISPRPVSLSTDRSRRSRAPSRPLRTTRRGRPTPVIRCPPRSGQAGEAPELAPSPAPTGAGRIRAAPGQESSGRRTRRRRQARSGADRVERPRAAPRITGGGREYPPRVGRGGRAGTACQRLPLLRCLFLDALASAAKGPLPCRETEEDEMCQRGFGTRQLDQALCRLCDRGRGSAGPVNQPTSGTALPMTRASSSLEAVLSRKAIGSAAAARCRVSSSE